MFEGRQVDRWWASRAGWRADVLRGRTNLNRCKLAQDLMHQCAIELRPDIIIIISEPNRQLPHCFNDTKGDASIWVTLLNGELPDETTEVKSDGIVGVRVGDVFCFSG